MAKSKRFLPLIAAILLIFMLAGCAEQEPPGAQLTNAADLTGKRIAYPSGTMFVELLDSLIENETYISMNDVSSMLELLMQKKCDAVAFDMPSAIYVVSTTKGFTYFKEPLVDDSYGFAGAKGSEIIAEISEQIELFWQDGTIEKYKTKWFSGDITDVTLDEPVFPNGEKATIRYGTDITTVPMATTDKDGNPKGYDIDVFIQAAARCGYRVELVPMDFAALIPAVVSGKVDACGGCMSISEERKKSVDFTYTYYVGGATMVVRDEAAIAAENKVGFFEQIAESFNRTFVDEDRYKLILNGLLITIEISILAAILGTVLGFGICMMNTSKLRLLHNIAQVFIKLFQGTPILVMLMIFFYVIFGKSDISGVFVAIIVFALNYAAYVSEIMRTGIQTVDSGQLEAATAMGFTKTQAFIKITAPQALRHILPVYKGEFIDLVKATSIVGYIAVQDLTKMSDLIRSKTYEAFFPLIATAIIYFAVANIFIRLLSYIEKKVDPKQRKRTLKGVDIHD